MVKYHEYEMSTKSDYVTECGPGSGLVCSIPELSKLTIFRYDRDIFSLRLLFDGHNRFWQNYIYSKNIFQQVCRKYFQCSGLCADTLSAGERESAGEDDLDSAAV